MRPRTRRIQYRWLPCKSLVNRVSGMPFQWSINPYRGCTHGCVYCYARATHPYLGLDGGLDFESVIFVKQGAVEALRRDLARPGWNREMVAIGTATDPYQPIEGKYRLMRGILRALIDAETPFSITTKNTLVLRDLDLLAEASRRAGCTVNISIPTVDPGLWRQLEPGTPHPAQRLRVLERLRAAGIRAGVFLAPILPGITDDRLHLEAVVKAAAQHGAAFLWPGVMHLAPGVREWVFPALARLRPDLMPMYRALYRGREAAPFYRESVLRRVEELKTRWGLAGPRPDGVHRVTPPAGTAPSASGDAGRAAAPTRPPAPVTTVPVAAMAGVTALLPMLPRANRPAGPGPATRQPGTAQRSATAGGLEQPARAATRDRKPAGASGRTPAPGRPVRPGHRDRRSRGVPGQIALPLPGV
ncbi:radical SAM protein [Thermaerobacter sp. PB12/4term]|uniref:radical SAM protein n=1 Tax=Thermaerobacter sp. PB12/4term TaxID=2293838 RepID=UPI001FAD7E7B|nr:radical SAM protein [Thermaerobacter sp. PB12/4term]